MSRTDLLEKFRAAVGDKNVYTGEKQTAYYRSGFRSGIGDALAVVFPETLLQQWQILEAAVDGGCAIIILVAIIGIQ